MGKLEIEKLQNISYSLCYTFLMIYLDHIFHLVHFSSFSFGCVACQTMHLKIKIYIWRAMFSQFTSSRTWKNQFHHLKKVLHHVLTLS